MIEWFESRLGRLGYSFSEFPVLKWWSSFFAFLILLAISLYQPLMVFLYKFNIMGVYVFQEPIKQNVKLVLWGQAIVPLVIALWGYLNISSLYEKKYLKRYKCLLK